MILGWDGAQAGIAIRIVGRSLQIPRALTIANDSELREVLPVEFVGYIVGCINSVSRKKV